MSVLLKEKQKFMVANWKMNPATSDEAISLAADIREALPVSPSVHVVLCPPFPFLDDVAREAGVAFELGAQDCSVYQEGAHTGEVSPKALASSGCSYVIVGHSERRAEGETNEQVNAKVREALKAGLRPIIAIGEARRDSFDASGRWTKELDPSVKDQLVAALEGVSASRAQQVLIAYEPVWAIGTGVSATVDDVMAVRILVQKILRDLYGASVEARIPILYGGSTNADSDALLTSAGVDGFLVGGSSLKPKEFAAMVGDAQRVATNT
jgi:triosephosphate isomerase